MSITVRHDAPIAGMGAVAGLTGQSLGATQAQSANNDMMQWLLGFKENQRQFDQRQDFAKRQADLDLGLRLRAQDIEQRRYNTDLAMQDARQQQLVYNQEANRQAQLAEQQMRADYDMAQQAMQQQDSWAMKSALTLDQQINEQFKGLRQMKLTPDGKLKLDELSGSWRKMQAESGNYRPGPFAAAQAQLLADIERADLDQYEIKEPTAQEKVYQNLVPLQGQIIQPGQPLPPGKYRSLKGTRNGQDTWETLDIPETQTPLTATERFLQNKHDLPNGGIALYDPKSEKWQEMGVPKSAPSDKPIDASKYLKEAVNQLRTEHQLSQAGKETPAPFKMNLEDAKKRARELMQAEQELMAEMGGGSEESDGNQIPPAQLISDWLNRNPDEPFTPEELPLTEGVDASAVEFSLLGDPMQAPDLMNAKRPTTREEVLSYQPGDIFFWNGQYARLESDGTVTVLE